MFANIRFFFISLSTKPNIIICNNHSTYLILSDDIFTHKLKRKKDKYIYFFA